MSKGEETRQGIIERAAPLFNQRGFHGCSMSEIMKATGLQKGGIYRHFSSKEELAEAVFHYSVDAAVKSRTEIHTGSDSPLLRLRALIARFVETPSPIPGGCPLLNGAIDTDDGNEALRALVRKAFQAWRKRLHAVIQDAIAAKEINDGTDVAWLVNTVIGTLEGAVMLSRLERSREPLLHAQHTLDLVLNSVAVKTAGAESKALQPTSPARSSRRN
ncbi:TetR/AcrR family transcriptional regulator [Terriglobus aquaticus]|uniref:TetR/AcrR family transcriptional regulator n=1 Tax=Terriglobus aquaticus TaxID=940139 RepID=A0ABW9KF02_9BACT|nr:TetR/AcrR family transcriptional regulator [Terriglobus aquaticus]